MTCYQNQCTIDTAAAIDQSFCLAALFIRGCRSTSSNLDTSLCRGRTSRSIRYKPVSDRLGNPNKGVIHVNVVLGRALPKVNAKLLGKLLSLLGGDDLLVEHVALVPDEDLVDVHVRVLLNLRDPVSDRLKGAAVRHVVDKENALCAAKVRRGNGAKPLLSGRVPDLKLDAGAFNVHVLDLEINANRGDKGGGEGIVGVTQQQARLSDARVANHEQLHLHVVGGAS